TTDVRLDPIEGISIIDVDTHLSEPHDLWTSRAPSGWEERVPRVVEVDGEQMWSYDGEVLGRAGASSVVRLDGAKAGGTEFMSWHIEDTPPGAYSVAPRLELMDRLGVWAQIVYPNHAVIRFGGNGLAAAGDPELRLLATRIYNDAMAEIQEESGGRLFPMAMTPFWDIDASVAEVTRAHELGLKGVNTSSDPQNQGCPDL